MVVPAFPNHRRLICAAPSPPERKGDTPQGQGEIAVDGHHPTGVRERRVVLATAVELLAARNSLMAGSELEPSAPSRTLAMGRVRPRSRSTSPVSESPRRA